MTIQKLMRSMLEVAYDDETVWHLMTESGALLPELVRVPCGDGETRECRCLELHPADDWQDGVTCYRPAAWYLSLMNAEWVRASEAQGGRK